MSLCKKLQKWFGPVPEGANRKLRFFIWCLTAVVCIACAVLVLHAGSHVTSGYKDAHCQPEGISPLSLAPGSTMVQNFNAQGKSTGEWCHFALSAYRDREDSGIIQVKLFSEMDDSPLSEVTLPISELPDYQPPSKEEPPVYTIFPMAHTIFVMSGRDYRIEITNQGQTDLILLSNPKVQSGSLLIDGQKAPGFINLIMTRYSLYRANGLTKLVTLIAVATVLAGLALVLFTQVKVHILYLILATGFGIVTLFDLTPIYGFDMRYQYDSTYVLSNQLLGLDGTFMAPVPGEEDAATLSYYRRACDDYSQYQIYYHDEVSANYTDTFAGLRFPFITEEEAQLVPAATHLGFVGNPLYLYLPQAIGFSIVRLLGLGMFPMLQMGRAVAYGVFVLLMFLVIRNVPFGKRIFLILSLVPTVLIQTVSLSQDAMILAMSFTVIGKALSMAYGDQKPRIWDWLVVLVFSVLLAPCKYVYLPVSCFFVLILYRQYLLPFGDKWKKYALRLGLVFLVLLALLIIPVFPVIRGILTASSGTSLYGTEAYTVGMLLTNPVHTMYVLANTLRNHLGTYLVNAVQLFDLRAGASDGITLIVFLMLFMEAFSRQTNLYTLKKRERFFMLLVFTGVFLLVALASLRWTPVTSNVIEGFQGRYLTPVLPLLFLACHNSRFLQIKGDTGLFVEAGCCIFPAIALMNMYLWTITRI